MQNAQDTMMPNNENMTQFGFEAVNTAEKQGKVHEVFRNVASRYDVMNDVMSMGMHRLWKNMMVDLIRPFNGMKMLDVAGGTGDITFRVLEKAARINATCHVTVCDINEHMLEQGRRRALDKGITTPMTWKQGNAEALPFADKSFDVYTIAFGIRNVTHIDRALAEAKRVLKPGGRFICLEFSHVKNPVLAKMYDAYSFNVIPGMGSMIAGNADAYRYLVESIRMFPAPEKFSSMISDAGLSQVRCTPLTAGVVAIHSAWRV